MEGLQSEEHVPKDISYEFASMGADFSDFLYSLRGEKSLHISADLSALDKDAFDWQAKRLKGFLEGRKDGQKRSATVYGTRDQEQWEPNVFNSGVAFKEV